MLRIGEDHLRQDQQPGLGHDVARHHVSLQGGLGGGQCPRPAPDHSLCDLWNFRNERFSQIGHINNNFSYNHDIFKRNWTKFIVEEKPYQVIAPLECTHSPRDMQVEGVSKP